MGEFDNRNAEQNFNQDQNPEHSNQYNQNPNQQANNPNSYSPNQNNNGPEYSFWAEQSSGNPYANYNQGAYSQGYSKNQSYENGQNYGNNQNYSYYQNYGNNQSYGNQRRNDQSMNYNPNGKKKKDKKPKNHKWLGLVGKALCFGLIAGLAFVGISQLIYTINPNSHSLVQQIKDNNFKETKYEIKYTSPASVKKRDRSTISEIVKQTMPAIVSIHCTSTQTSDWFGQKFSQEVEGSGSGFIVGKNEKELLIATNNHVVEGATKISVTFTDGTSADALIKGTDATADLAVVAIDVSTMEQSTLDKISVAKLGNSDDVKVGEMAIAIGNAMGYGQSVTVGYISAKDREVTIQSDSYNTKKMVLLQTDAAINPGNSGGALLNVDGEVIGINTVKYASDEVEGMGYAIPISKATSIINELMTREILEEKDQGYLGIAGNDVTEDVASYYNMPIGVFINEITEGGAAEKAGLLANDIITKVDKVEITSISQLKEYVTSKRVGTEVTVTYMRKTGKEYKEGTVTVTLGQNPNLSNK